MREAIQLKEYLVWFTGSKASVCLGKQGMAVTNTKATRKQRREGEEGRKEERQREKKRRKERERECD